MEKNCSVTLRADFWDAHKGKILGILDVTEGDVEVKPFVDDSESNGFGFESRAEMVDVKFNGSCEPWQLNAIAMIGLN